MLHLPKAPYIGAAYYPECREEALVDEDIAKMKEAGVNCVRMAEFAWGAMEPREGDFRFDWLVRVLDKLHRAGIAAVLCTPSATPPKWLTDKYEETLQMYDNGRRAQFGGRCHICKTSPVMREKNRILVTRLCEAVKDHPAVIGWQIDNELYNYQNGCFCPLCRKKFQNWLQTKYKTIAALNDAWGGERWSQRYDAFEAVIPPRSDTWNHPSLQVEWERFTSDNTIEYAHEQAEVIHKYFRVPVGTDMMPMFGIDHYKMNEKLDIAQVNHYEKEGDLDRASFWFDFFRCIFDRLFWVTETQAGWAGNKETWLGWRSSGNCYVNTWLPVAKGAEMNSYWLWRAHFAGHEMHHGSILSSSGRFNHIIGEIRQASDEFERCAGLLRNSAVRSKIALTCSATSGCHLKYSNIVPGMQYDEVLYRHYHRALRGYNVDVIDTEHSLEGYHVLFSPLLTHAEEHGFKERVLAWVREGGRWIVGPMSDIYTDACGKYRNAPFGFLEEVSGARLKYQIPLDDAHFSAEWNDGEELGVSLYYDGYEPNGAKSLAVYTDGVMKGLSAITEMPYGKGSIVLCGALPDRRSILKLVGAQPILHASENVEIVERTGEEEFLVCLELENAEGELHLDRQYFDVLSGETLEGTVKVPPYRVFVLQAKK